MRVVVCHVNVLLLRGPVGVPYLDALAPSLNAPYLNALYTFP